jgi:hypothetical protein
MYGGATAEFFAKIWKKFQKFGPKMRKNPLRIQKIHNSAQKHGGEK